jgi:hypothetical protein
VVNSASRIPAASIGSRVNHLKAWLGARTDIGHSYSRLDRSMHVLVSRPEHC